MSQANTLFFYCKYDDPERNSFLALARSFITQALVLDRDLLPYIYEEASTSGESPLTTGKRARNILSDILQSFEQLHIIIDGLDECPPNEKNSIATWFQKTAKPKSDGNSAHIRCLFLSQRDRETGNLFKDIPMMNITSSDLENDIKTFCDIESRKVADKFDLNESERSSLLDKVRVEAKGNISALLSNCC